MCLVERARRGLRDALIWSSEYSSSQTTSWACISSNIDTKRVARNSSVNAIRRILLKSKPRSTPPHLAINLLLTSCSCLHSKIRCLHVCILLHRRGRQWAVRRIARSRRQCPNFPWSVRNCVVMKLGLKNCIDFPGPEEKDFVQAPFSVCRHSSSHFARCCWTRKRFA